MEGSGEESGAMGYLLGFSFFFIFLGRGVVDVLLDLEKKQRGGMGIRVSKNRKSASGKYYKPQDTRLLHK